MQPQIAPESPPSLHINPSLNDSFPNKSNKLPLHSSLYNSLHSGDIPPPDQDPLKSSINGFTSAPYRTSTAFNAFTNPRQRQHTAPPGGGPFRDTYSQPYPTAADVFGTNQVQSPTAQQLPHVDPMSSSARLYDYDPPLTSKSLYNGVHEPRYSAASAFPQSQHVPINKPSLPAQQHPTFIPPTPSTYSAPNGLPGPVSSQSQFSASQAAGNPISAGQGAQGEEISTIFVVGFPDDMQEREFQNMFTFSSGFEAATLKIPNKDSNAYGNNPTQTPTAAMRSGSYYPNMGYPGEQYNGEGINPELGPHGSQIPAMPPRKQIIGFAKFKTRSEALEARDVLQGRRVDIEKGAVLKAEMAKKNLHTKRGVGPLGLPISLMNTGGTVNPDTLAGLAGINGLVSPSVVGNGEILTQRERELGAIGAMGLGGVVSQRSRDRERDREDEEKIRRVPPPLTPGMGLSGEVPRLRGEEEERERRRKEKESSKIRMNAYDAFHSVPATHLTRNPSGSQSLVSPSEPMPLTGYPFPNTPIGPTSLTSAVSPFSSQDVFAPVGTASTWGIPTKADRFAQQSKTVATGLPPRPPSSHQSSPHGESSFPSSSSSSVRAEPLSGSSPPHVSASLPSHHHSKQNRSHSPPSGSESMYPDRSLPPSSGSSVGSQDGDVTQRGVTISLGMRQGTTSPQLPSPASGGSSATTNTRTNASDQNPPINTLYVGNLPTTPPPTLPANHLEESLRSLFSRCPGYRKLCFRQKSNGPMCFVEFEDVQFATRALSEMYGNTLNGIVKGGIRLSFSKNPLGVRTPTNGSTNQPRNDGPGVHPPETMSQSRYLPPVDVNLPRSRADESMSPISGTSYQYATSPPPSRFFSPPPSSRAFSQVVAQPPGPAYSRQGSQIFGAPPLSQPVAFNHMPSSATIHGYPFPHDDHGGGGSRDIPPHALTPSPSLEVARAG